MSLVRVTGTVLNVEERSGVSKATGKPWAMLEAKVFVAERDVTTVMLPERFQGVQGIPSKGDDVDWLVQVRASGGFVNFDARDVWPSSVVPLKPAPPKVS